MAISTERETQANAPLVARQNEGTEPIARISSRDLFRQMREVEIAHEGRIYRLRLTQLNKLILTA